VVSDVTVSGRPAEVRTTRLRKAATALYGTLGTVMVITLALFTITATQTPPPAIAEIAPQAAEQIKEAPKSQTSESGSAEGGGLGGVAAVAETTTTLPAVPGATTTTTARIERARVRRCVGSPPRQTEDPQSPPCVPFWEGDNGGATAKGVTRDTITLVAPCPNVPCGGPRQQTHKAYEAYLNKRFELYGRRLRIEFAADGGNAECVKQKAAVTELDATFKPFAVLDTNQANGACFHLEAGRRGIISGVSNDLFAESELQALHPYMWEYSMAYEGLFSGIGDMICGRLQGGKAKYSPAVALQQADRKFGVVLQVAERDGDISLRPLQRAMAKCGAKLDVQITQRFGLNDPNGATEAQRAVAELTDKKITSVVCLCWIFREQYMPAAATNQNYFPEWILSSYGMNDTGWVQTYWTPEQRRSVIGVGSRTPSLTQPNDPACYAATEGDPTVTCGADRGGGQSSDGADHSGKTKIPDAWNVYRTLLLIASGIQMAGPNLTPATFAAGLQSTKFAYPPDDPTHAGDVGFLDGDHSMADTLVEYWWSETSPRPNGEERGALCYVDHGARRRVGAWPQQRDPFYQPLCDNSGDP
jgi:hypothetical protein